MNSTKKNFAYQLMYQILNTVLPFLTSPYIARVLGAEQVGIYSYTFSIVTYFMLVANLGISNYGNRLIAQNRENQENLNKEFSSLLALHLAISTVTLIVYYLYTFSLGGVYKTILLIQSMNLISALFDVSWFFFGIEKFKLTVTRNTIIRVAGVVCIFLFVKTENDLWIYTVIMAGFTLLNQVALWPFLRKYTRLVKFRIKDALAHIKPLLVLFAAVIAVSIFSYMDKIMLGNMSSMTELGYYENAFKVIQFPVSLITALGTVMLPKISNIIFKGEEGLAKEYIRKSMLFSMALAYPLAFGLAAVSDNFSVVFWGAEFEPCGDIITILAVTAIIMSWNGVVRSQYLIPKERDKSYLIAVCCGAVVNVIANAILIPILDARGAAWGTVLAYITICVVQNFCVRKDLPLFKYFLDSVFYLLFSIVMYIGVKLIHTLFDISLISLLIEVVAGVVIYAIIAGVYCFIKKDEVYNQVMQVLNKVKLR